MVAFLNPPTVHTPAGNYTHTALVPDGMELVFVSGQVGVRPDGSIPSDFATQVEVVFENLQACLAAHGLDMSSIIKLNAYLVAGTDIQALRNIRQRFLGEHRPTSTAVFVPALVRPEFLLEVEAMAARAAPRAG